MFDEIQWNFAQMIDLRKRIHRPVYEPTRPTQRPLLDIFTLDFDFFVLIFKTVWWISMKLHTNDRRREYLLQLIFENTSPQQRPLAAIFILWRPFWNLFLLITSKPFDGFQRNFTQVIDGERCQHIGCCRPYSEGGPVGCGMATILALHTDRDLTRKKYREIIFK